LIFSNQLEITNWYAVPSEALPNDDPDNEWIVIEYFEAMFFLPSKKKWFSFDIFHFYLNYCNLKLWCWFDECWGSFLNNVHKGKTTGF
jgi:hypothetical protein